MQEQIEREPIVEGLQQKNAKNSNKKIIIIIGVLVVVAALAIGGGLFYYQQGPCGVARVKAAVATMQHLGAEWDDANKLAGTTGRGSLSGPISNLQKIARDANDLNLPGCMDAAKAAMTAYMEDTVDGYILFMSQMSSDSATTDAQVNQKFNLASTEYDTFETLLSDVQKCAPFCK
jgi:hypothetical protein